MVLDVDTVIEVISTKALRCKHHLTIFLVDIVTQQPITSKAQPAFIALMRPSTQPRDMTRSPPNINPHPPSSYYEDVEPRFALPMNGVESADVPSSLVPGSSGEPLLQNSSDGLPGGARSSAVSEASHFTSISQRGINPKWRPADSENPKPKIHQQCRLHQCQRFREPPQDIGVKQGFLLNPRHLSSAAFSNITLLRLQPL
ncbi:hypothetical protein CIHG_04971 [Coccidioides immitis H538.4]|uniref:Uncharacterized protein n=1 Tax=Coccidioides immitis H538.4 TaxID=396776 RepID=A0A0J8RQW8_COCIT|nr:hypothetical protein CIHG_04971 [Coccidioides immitis H538.4]